MNANQVDTSPDNYGEIVLPVMQQLPKKLKQVTAGMLSTLDGFNVCSIGFSKNTTDKLAAVNSSLFTIAENALDNFRQSESQKKPIDMVFVTSDNLSVISLKVQFNDAPDMVLTVAAEKTEIGSMVYVSRYIREELIKLLNSQ